MVRSSSFCRPQLHASYFSSILVSCLHSVSLSLSVFQACWTARPWCCLVVTPWTPLWWQLVSVAWFPTCWIPATPQASPVWAPSLRSQLSWYTMCFAISEVCFCSQWGHWRGKSDWNSLTCRQAEHIRMLLKDFNKHQEEKGIKKSEKFKAGDGPGWSLGEKENKRDWWGGGIQLWGFE